MKGKYNKTDSTGGGDTFTTFRSGTDSHSREIRCVKTGKRNSLDLKIVRLHLKKSYKITSL